MPRRTYQTKSGHPGPPRNPGYISKAEAKNALRASYLAFCKKHNLPEPKYKRPYDGGQSFNCPRPEIP